MDWRRISEDGVSAAGGLAADEVLALRAGRRESEPTLRLYSYRPNVALVGRFQDSARELDLDYCAANGIEVNRRPTGGGAILMGPDQLGVALTLGRSEAAAIVGGGRAREMMARFSGGLARGLELLGIDSAFRGKNDLEVGGLKIAGLGISRDASGGLLFHASLLLDLDVELMTRVLRTPFEKLSRKALNSIEARTATVRKLIGAATSFDELREAVAIGFARSFDRRLVARERLPAERAEIERLMRDKYQSDAWIHQRNQVPDYAGAATLATGAGLIDLRVTLAGRTIKAVHLRGDFIEDERAVADLEGSLRWHSSDSAAIASSLSSWASRHPSGTLECEPLASALSSAVANARELTEPYGCFVGPRGEGTRGGR